jgi:monofunctional biosynthetic peptidoglycan transglycosylase
MGHHEVLHAFRAFCESMGRARELDLWLAHEKSRGLALDEQALAVRELLVANGIGVSRGGAKLIDGNLHFRGVLSLENNGGFSSIRSGGPTRDLSAAKVIVLRVKGDGRTYRLQLATNAEFRRSRISYQAEFPTKRGEWTEVIVPLASLVPQFRGQKLAGPTLNRTRIEEIGLSLSDGNPGAFALEVDWIKAE